MTLEEAQTIVNIFSTADGGCDICDGTEANYVGTWDRHFPAPPEKEREGQKG